MDNKETKGTLSPDELSGDVLIDVADALGELESQAVDLHSYDISEAKKRCKKTQECLCAALQKLKKTSRIDTSGRTPSPVKPEDIRTAIASARNLVSDGEAMVKQGRNEISLWQNKYCPHEEVDKWRNNDGEGSFLVEKCRVCGLQRDHGLPRKTLCGET